MDFLELPVREWRKIAVQGSSAELHNYLKQFADASQMLILHPVEQNGDTDEVQAVEVDDEHRRVMTAMLTEF